MRLTDLSEDGKVLAALWIAESAMQMIGEKAEYHHFCRETIDLCWEWLMNRNIDIWDIYDRISCNKVNLLDIVIDAKKGSDLAHNYNMILVSVTYVDWQAFNYDEDEPGYPEDLNEMSDEEYERVINIWIDKKIIERNWYESLLHYLKDNYREENRSAFKEKIMELAKNR